jgi:hypothetical protein
VFARYISCVNAQKSPISSNLVVGKSSTGFQWLPRAADPQQKKPVCGASSTDVIQSYIVGCVKRVEKINMPINIGICSNLIYLMLCFATKGMSRVQGAVHASAELFTQTWRVRQNKPIKYLKSNRFSFGVRHFNVALRAGN